MHWANKDPMWHSPGFRLSLSSCPLSGPFPHLLCNLFYICIPLPIVCHPSSFPYHFSPSLWLGLHLYLFFLLTAQPLSASYLPYAFLLGHFSLFLHLILSKMTKLQSADIILQIKALKLKLVWLKKKKSIRALIAWFSLLQFHCQKGVWESTYCMCVYMCLHVSSCL